MKRLIFVKIVFEGVAESKRPPVHAGQSCPYLAQICQITKTKLTGALLAVTGLLKMYRNFIEIRQK